MATIVYQNSTRNGAKVSVVVKVGERNHMIVIPGTTPGSRAEKEGITEDEALLAFLTEPFKGHTLTTPSEAFMTELKGHLSEAFEVQQSVRSPVGRTGSSDPGLQRSEQRRSGVAAGVADDPRPVPSRHRRRVVARKHPRHG